MTDTGHNSGASDEIRAFVERIERMQDEISLHREDMKEIFSEAKGRGYDTKTLRRLVALRKKNPDQLAEEMAMLQMYGSALGMDNVFL